MPTEPGFEMAVPEEIADGQTLVVGLSNLGLGGVTAVDYLVRHLESTEIGHVSPDALPAITPFEDGRPRHHTRLYNLANEEFIVLVGELFVPVPVARSFADVLGEWIQAESMAEIAIMHGVPFPHSHEEHKVFYIATDAYQKARLEGAACEPLKGGFLDGVAGELMSRSLEGQVPPVGVFTTPTHPPGPDIEAAFRFLDTLEAVYDVSVDRTELEKLSAEIKQYYAELADRMAAMEESDRGEEGYYFPEDRMYM